MQLSIQAGSAPAKLRRRKAPAGSAGYQRWPALTRMPRAAARRSTSASDTPWGQRDPQVQSAAGQAGQAAGAQVAMQRGGQGVAPGAQRRPQAAQVTRPALRRDQLQRGLLQDAGDEEVVGQPSRAQPLQGRATGADGADAQARRGAFGE